MLSEAPTSSDWKCHQKGCKRPHWKQTFLIVVSLPYIWSCYPYGIVLCRLGFPDVRAGSCQIGVVTIACITGVLWAKQGERGISRSATRARRGEEKTSACYQSIVLALPTFTSLHGYVHFMDMFQLANWWREPRENMVCLSGMALTRSSSGSS